MSLGNARTCKSRSALERKFNVGRLVPWTGISRWNFAAARNFGKSGSLPMFTVGRPRNFVLVKALRVCFVHMFQ
jgi:hypothetical protein